MTDLDMWRDEFVERLDAARRLHADIEKQVSASFPRVASIAEEIKRAHPELADQIDQVAGHSLLRSTLMPQLLTSLFWAQTEDPPAVVEGRSGLKIRPQRTRQKRWRCRMSDDAFGALLMLGLLIVFLPIAIVLWLLWRNRAECRRDSRGPGSNRKGHLDCAQGGGLRAFVVGARFSGSNPDNR